MAPIPGKHVLFLAVQPTPAAAAAAVARLNAASRPGRASPKAIPASRLNVPLYEIGTFKRPPGPILEKAVDVVRRAAVPAFSISLDRLGSWRSGAISLWSAAGAAGVEGLYEDVHRELIRAEMASRRDPPFEPCMALSYDPASMPETVVDPVSWQVEEFVLIHAVQGEGRFQIIERFPLEP